MRCYTFTLQKLLVDGPIARPCPFAAQPAGSLIFNAPRPICGDNHATDNYVVGVFFTQVMLHGYCRNTTIRLNHDAQAVILEYVTEATAEAELRAHYLAKYGDEGAEILAGYDNDPERWNELWRSSWYEACAKSTIQIEIDPTAP